MPARAAAVTAPSPAHLARRVARSLALERPAAAALAIIALGTLARVVAGAVTSLSVDESYAVSVTRRLTLSYFDHPPLAFWIPGVVGKLTGSEAALVLRLPFIALFAGTSWLLYRLTARLFGERAGACAALLLTVSPVFTFSTGGWVIPDGPLMFAMLAAALCLERILVEGDDARSWRWWLGAGLFAGLAMLSKYHGVFVAFAALLFTATRRDARRWLLRPEPYVAAALALALFSPALIWNAEHAWVSFRYQGDRGAPSGGVHLLDLFRSLGGQAAYLLPWIWVPAAWLLVKALAGGPADKRAWFLACLAVGPIAFFTLPALGGHPGLPHWEAPGWLFTFPLLGAAADRLLTRAPVRGRVWLAGSALTYGAIWVLGVSQMALGWVGSMAPALVRRGDPSWELVGWQELAPVLAARGLPGPNGFVAATRWMDAGKAAYALGPAVPVVCVCEHPHHFHFLNPQERFLGRDAVLVLPPDADTGAVAPLLAHFRFVQPLGSVVVHRLGRAEFRLPLYLARGFLSPVAIDLPH